MRDRVRSQAMWLGVGVCAVLASFALRPVQASGILPEGDWDEPFASSVLDRDVQRLFAAQYETPHFIVHYMSTSAVSEQLQLFTGAATAVLTKVRLRLGLEAGRKIHLYLHPSRVLLGRTLGRRVEGALCVAGSMHASVDMRDVELMGALVRAHEPAWARAGGLGGVRLPFNAWTPVRLVCQGGKLRVWIQEVEALALDVEQRPRALSFSVSEGRVALRAARLRRLFASADKGAESGWERKLPFESTPRSWWFLHGQQLRGISHVGSAKALLSFADGEPTHFEFAADVRLSVGAQFALGLDEDGETATQVTFSDDGIQTARSVVSGPLPAVRRAFVDAVSASEGSDGRSVVARILLERGHLLSMQELIEQPANRSNSHDWRRRVQLAAFVDFLIATHGIDGYRKFYFSAHRGGESGIGPVAELVSAWQAHLRELTPTREQRVVAERKVGLTALEDAVEWATLLPAPKLLFTYRPKTAKGLWRKVGKKVTFHSSSNRSAALDTLKQVPELVVIGVRVELDGQTEFQVVVHDDRGRASTARVSPQQVELTGPKGVPAAKAQFVFPIGRAVDLVFVLPGNGAGQLYLDGQLLLEADDDLSEGGGKLSLQAIGTGVTLSRVSVGSVP